MILKRTSSENAGFQNLVHLLDKDLALRNGATDAFYSQFNKIDSIQHVVVYTNGHDTLGCGAFKAFDHETVEIKRMYVLPPSRGKGIAISILNELERWASELDYKSCVLETGKNNHEAVHLYRKQGYHIVPNYGQYAGMDESICMKKELRG